MTPGSKPPPDKSRGQHFLVDPRVSQKIAALLELSDVSTIVEIGPGRGALTAELLRTGKRVVAVEVDRRMAAYLRHELSPELEIIESSILDADPRALLGRRRRGRAVLAGNLPYNLGGPILEWIFASAECWSQVVVMLQLEVARRLVAEPQTRDFGPLAVARALHFEASKRFLVRPGAFFPKPRVTSAVVDMRPCSAPPVSVTDSERFVTLVHLLFAHRRKNIRNNLKLGLSMGDEALDRLFAEADVDERHRAEELSWQDLQRLYAAFAQESF